MDRHDQGVTVMADNASRIEGVYDAFARGDIETVLAAMDPQIEWNEAEHVTFWNGAPFVGPDAVVEGVFARIPATFGDTFRIQLLRFVDCGSTVLVEVRYQGVAQATGEEFDIQAAHVWDFGPDGTVNKFQQYADTWEFARVTGETPVS